MNSIACVSGNKFYVWHWTKSCSENVRINFGVLAQVKLQNLASQHSSHRKFVQDLVNHGWAQTNMGLKNNTESFVEQHKSHHSFIPNIHFMIKHPNLPMRNSTNKAREN